MESSKSVLLWILVTAILLTVIDCARDQNGNKIPKNKPPKDKKKNKVKLDQFGNPIYNPQYGNPNMSTSGFYQQSAPMQQGMYNSTPSSFQNMGAFPGVGVQPHIPQQNFQPGANIYPPGSLGNVSSMPYAPSGPNQGTFPSMTNPTYGGRSDIATAYPAAGGVPPAGYPPSGMPQTYNSSPYNNFNGTNMNTTGYGAQPPFNGQNMYGPQGGPMGAASTAMNIANLKTNFARMQKGDMSAIGPILTGVGSLIPSSSSTKPHKKKEYAY